MALTSANIWRHLDGLTKPPCSLGRLEELAVRLCVIQQTLAPKTTPRRLVIFAADHGVAASGVTAWPMSVTGLMVRNMCSGGAASTVLARQAGVDVVLVNVGTSEEPIADPSAVTALRYRSSRLCSGTRNLSEEPALTIDEFQRSWEIGAEEASIAARDGMRLVIAGEMGIGNTTSAACLAMLLAAVPLLEAVGRGAGADDATLQRKRAIVDQAVLRARALVARDPLTATASVAGLEIAAIAGFLVAAQAAGLTIVLDGYVASAAALIAKQQSPQTTDAMIAAHLSAEPGHARVLEQLGLSPFLDWQMRLGEGTGALALLPQIDAAAAIVGQMATLESWGIKPRGT